MTQAPRPLELQELQGLLEGIDAIVWEADPDTFRYTYVAGHPDSLLGYRVDEWQAPGFWHRMLHPADRETVEARAREETAAGRNHHLEYRVVTADGREVWVHDQVRVVLDGGRVVRLRGVMVDVTARRRERQELEFTRNQLQAVLGSIDTIVYSHSLDLTERRYINSAAARIFGRPLDEFTTRPRVWLEAVHPEDLPRVQLALAEAVLQGGYDVEYRIIRPDGAVVWLRDRARIVPGNSGTPDRLDGVALDITLRKEAELALQRSEEQVRGIIDAALDAVITTDEAGRITGWNHGAQAMFGWTSGEVRGRSLEQVVVAPEQRAGHLRWFRRFRDRNREALPRRFETSVVHRDGRPFPVEVSVSAVRVGDHWSFSAFLRDITERRKADDALRESESRYRALVNSAPDAIFTLDTEGRIVSLNPAFQIRMGRLGRDWVGQPFDPLVDPDDVAEARRALGLVLTRRAVAPRFEIRLRPASGATFIAEVTISPMLRDGKVVGVIGVARDVTERREAEAALERYARELEEARARAVEASRAKAEFLAKMSHEIRTPMNGVMGMISLLLETELAREQRGFAEMAHRSAEGLLSLINDILDFSRLEAGKLVLHPAPFDLAKLTHEVTTLLAPRVEERGLDLTVRIEPGLPTQLMGDGVRVRQVLTNLLGNAVKFTDRGRIAVDVRRQTGPQGEPAVAIAVDDTGIGISLADQALLFTEFHHVANHHDRGTSSGLGLAITRQLVELMRGELDFTSVPGRGSCFTALVPLDPAGGHPYPGPGPAGIRGASILLVEPDPLARAALGELVEAWGLRPVPAGSLTEADAIVTEGRTRSGTWAAVVTTDGEWDRLRELLADPALHGRVVLLTPPKLNAEARRQLGDAVSACLIRPAYGPAVLSSLASALTSAPPRFSGMWRVPDPADTTTIPAEPTAALQVLLVEDNEVNQLVAIRLLEKLGCEVVVARTGVEGVDRYASAEFDLVLMDLQMPEMDGFEATGQIRRLEATSGRHTPIIAITANAMVGDRERCLAAGMDDYVSKPIALADLFHAITRTVASAPARVTPVPEGAV